MRLVPDAKGYANEDNAIQKLADTLAKAGLTLDSVRWLIAINREGRFVPTIVIGPNDGHLIGLVHRGIAVVN